MSSWFRSTRPQDERLAQLDEQLLRVRELLDEAAALRARTAVHLDEAVKLRAQAAQGLANVDALLRDTRRLGDVQIDASGNVTPDVSCGGKCGNACAKKTSFDA